MTTQRQTLKAITVEAFLSELLGVEDNGNLSSRALARLTYGGQPMVIQTTFCRLPWTPSANPGNPNLRVSVSLEDESLRKLLCDVDDYVLKWAANDARLCKSFGLDMQETSEEDLMTSLRHRYCSLVKRGTRGYADLFKFKIYASRDIGEFACNISQQSGSVYSEKDMYTPVKLTLQNIDSVLRNNSKVAGIIEIRTVWCMGNQFGLVVKANSLRVQPPQPPVMNRYDWA